MIVDVVALTEFMSAFVKLTLYIFELLIFHQVEIVESLTRVFPVVEAAAACARDGEK